MYGGGGRGRWLMLMHRYLLAEVTGCLPLVGGAAEFFAPVPLVPGVLGDDALPTELAAPVDFK